MAHTHEKNAPHETVTKEGIEKNNSEKHFDTSEGATKRKNLMQRWGDRFSKAFDYVHQKSVDFAEKGFDGNDIIKAAKKLEDGGFGDGTKLYNTVAEGGSRVASNIYNSLASAPEKFKAWRENKTAEKNAITADRGELTNSIGALAKEKNPSMLSRAQEGISGLFKKIRSFGEFAETNGFLMTKKERNDYHEVLRKFKEDGLKEKATADHAHPQAGAILKKGELFDTFKRIFAEAGGHGGGDNHYDHHYPLAGGGHH